MKICICDTDDLICNELIKNISDCFLSTEAFSVKCIFSPEELLTFSEEKYCFDVYFIKADENGVAAAEIIRRTSKNAIIVLTSDSEEYVYEAFKVEALYYIVKPVNNEEFSELFRRILAKYKSYNSNISLRWKNERYNIKISDIIYVEGYNRHLTFYTTEGEFSSVGKIQNIFEKLCIHGFLRIHQGYTVNMNHIKHFNTNEVIMDDGTKVMISIRRRSEALRIYDDFIKIK